VKNPVFAPMSTAVPRSRPIREMVSAIAPQRVTVPSARPASFMPRIGIGW
jgi:hypothetical protein